MNYTRRIWDQEINMTPGISQLLVQTEQCQKLASQILKLLNQSDSHTDLIKDIIYLVKASTGFEAVGIRLREGEDFPYYETTGFSKDFVNAERYLCARDNAGAFIRDSGGNPYLECMCGNILSGRTDPALPFFTEGGSFWTNCTTALLASTTEEDRQGPTRNRCNSQGYESVALIPIHYNKEIAGLLQLNDRRKNMFSSSMIRFFEGMVTSISITLKLRKKEGESLRELPVDSRIDTFMKRPGKTGASLHEHQNLLSKREHEILKLITCGMSAREIGDRLFISERTVTTHRSRIMYKLNIHKSIELVRYALDNGFNGEDFSN